ncbi:MAG TPA: GNAT family N-acetyltransferase [Arenimonas sp.]|uniref:GNAT family N-acetyltransferase n=1 Tax=Arenimonas sp. TaxID=1872635 RepID=UPI002D7F2C09|nr:GNAT family N-acetyltransferase [Arenimonas sp.]HEU0152403.1 GNAT family N-acetyltransferase [Arenimonas sp.]
MSPRPRKPSRPSLQAERTEVLRLADGRELWLRPVQPADAGPIAGGFELLGEEEVRRRYLHPVKALSEDYLQQLVAPPPGEGFAVCAAEPLPPGEALVGAVARLTRDPGSDSAEFAILVSHFVSGQGLGQALMLRLLEWARAHGVHRIWGDVLDENTTMIALAQSLGFERHASPDDPGLVRVTLDLAPKARRRR